MSCQKHLPLVLALVAGVVVACVRGQDNQPAAWGPNAQGGNLGAELRSVGRMVTAEYQSANAPQVLQVPGSASPLPTSTLKLVAANDPVANDPVGNDGLRSVLVRPGDDNSPPAQRPEGRLNTDTPAVSPRTAMLPPPPSNPGSSDPIESSAVTAPPKPAEIESIQDPTATRSDFASPDAPAMPPRATFTPPTTTYEPLISPRNSETTETTEMTTPEETKQEASVVQPSAPLGMPAGGLQPLTGPDEDPRASSRRTFGVDTEREQFQALENVAANPPSSANAPGAMESSPLPLDRRTLGSGLISSPPATAPTPPATGILATSVGPLLRVETKGPKAVTLGEPADFVITIANPGTADAENVTVRVAIPGHVKLVAANSDIGSAEHLPGGENAGTLSWTLQKLTARSDAKLTLQLAPQANRPFELAVDWSILPMAAAAQVEVQQPMLEIAVQGPEQIVFGETKIYSIVLSNPGTGDAKNVTVNLALGSEQADTLNVGTIAAGKSQKYDVEVSARQPGVLQITAAAKADFGLSAQAVEQISVLKAELQLEALGSRVKYAGSVGTYQVRVKNSGNAVAAGVQMQVQLPLGVKYFQGLTDATQTGQVLEWQVGDLGADQDKVFVFYCQLDTAGDATLNFVAKSAGLQAAAETTTRVEALADLKLAVNDPKGPLPVGQEVTYEISIVNRGTKAAMGVNVVAQFSEGIEPIAAEGAPAELVPGQVLFTPIERIAPNETVVLKVKAKAETDGNHLFRSEVRCSDPETRLVAEDTTQYFACDMFDPAGTANSPSDRNDGFVPVGSRP